MEATSGSIYPSQPAVRFATSVQPAHVEHDRSSTEAGVWTGIGGLLRRLRALFAPRLRPSFGWAELVSLALFSLVLAWVIPHHESWFDEAQAWLIARDSTLWDLVVHRLHYEGSPALWHLLLWAEIRMGVSFLGMHAIAGCLAVLGAFVWLRFSLLPRVIYLIAPFAFFIQYQYAVVARSYVLAPLFAYVLMALYQNRRSSPVLFCVVAGLFANCSLHMAAFAAGLSVMYAVDRWKASRAGCPVASPQQLVGAGAVLAILFAAAAATAVPTADGSSTTANPVVSALRKTVPHAGALQKTENPNELTDAVDQPAEPPAQGRLAQAMWRAMSQHPSADGSHPTPRWLDGRILRHVLVFLAGATASVSTSNVLALGFLLLLAVNLVQARLWIALLPWACIELCNVLVAGEAHHFGLLWIALTCAVWALSAKPSPGGRADGWRIAVFGYLAVVLLLQIGWSVHAVWGDVRQPYSSSRAAATFLAGLPAGARVAGFDDDSVTVNAYLPRSPYFNQPVDYWPFSRTRDPSLFLEQTMAQHPDVVSLKMAEPDKPVMYQWLTMTAPGTEFVAQAPLRLLLANGYHETHRFCGHRFFRDAAESTDCRLIFEPMAPTPATP